MSTVNASPGYNPVLLGAVDATIIMASLGEYAGTSYYVNGDTGNDTTGDGLSWATAFATPQAAITASEVVRLARTTNLYLRNRIFIQGGSADYAPITSLPNYTDIIGVGAESRGNGTGIVVISGGASSSAMTGTSTGGEMRGCTFTNIQFKVLTDTYWCVDAIKVLRTTFTNCAFMCATGTGMSAGGGIRTTSSTGGVTIQDCHFGTNGAGQLKYGVYVTASTTMNNWTIIHNHITAITAGIYLGGSVDDTNTIIKENTIGGGTSTQIVNGIVGGTHSLAMGNIITASSTAISSLTTTNRVGNHVINNVTGAMDIASS
jgi:hypothetical protein